MGHKTSKRVNSGLCHAATRRRSWLRNPVWAPAIALILAGCVGSPQASIGSSSSTSHINDKTKFSSAAFGVDASPRVTTAKRPKKGGGRAMVGKPYRVRGKWYKPKEEPGYDKAGLASWYGPNFHGRLTANGEIYDQFHLSAAHPTFPLPSYARVTNKKNGNSVIVRVNDRGPFAHGRIIDLSNQAATLLDMKHDGVAAVRVQYIGRAPVEGDDTSYLMASYRPGGSDAPAGGVIASGVMLAMNGAASLLPGVKPAPEGLAPLTPVGAVSALQSPVATATADMPIGFTLPSIGPIVPDRPSFGTPVAAYQPVNGSPARTLSFWQNAYEPGRAMTPFEIMLEKRRNSR